MDAKLSYNATKSRVRLNLMARDVHNPEFDPQSFIDKARAKLESVKATGDIDCFYIFEKQFMIFWERLKNQPPLEKQLQFDLGFGAHNLSLEIIAGTKKAIGMIAELEGAQEGDQYKDLLVNVMIELQNMDLDIHVNEECIKSAFLRWKAGKLPPRFPLFPNHAELSSDLSVGLNRHLGDAYLYVGNQEYFADVNGLKNLLKEAKIYAKKVQKRVPESIFDQELFVETIKEHMTGLASLGIGLPKAILLTSPMGSNKPLKKAQEKKSLSSEKNIGNSKSQKKKGQDPLIYMVIEPSGMEAVVEMIDPKVYEDQIEINQDVLMKELEKNDIVHGFEAHMEQALIALQDKDQAIGQVLATGEPPIPGHEIYIHKLYLDSIEMDEVEDEVEQEFSAVDIRDSLQQEIVDPNQVFAELRYRDGSIGKNIFGKEVYPEVDEEGFKLKIGENVARNAQGQFVSGIHGMPNIELDKISVSPIYIHKGDVNLSTGRVEFDGNAIIIGNVESGGRIEVTGNLEVKGMIAQAYVKVGGDLVVKGGILTSDKGFVHVKGNLSSEFVENSQVLVNQNMKVKNSVMNSNVIVGGSLTQVTNTGIIGGGSIHVRKRIMCGNLGLDIGTPTMIQSGSDWKVERSISINKSRQENIKAYIQDTRHFLSELKANKKADIPAKPKFPNALKRKEKETRADQLDPEFFANKIRRAEKLVRKLEKAHKGLLSKRKWNENALVLAKNKIAQNIEIYVAGKRIPLKRSLISVMISYRKFAEGRINPARMIKMFNSKFGKE